MYSVYLRISILLYLILLLDSVLLLTVTDIVSLKMINMNQNSCNIIQQSKHWFNLTPHYRVITLNDALNALVIKHIIQ